MADDVVIPHFDYPFQFNANGRVQVVEQDSEDDIINCVVALIKTPLGFREDLPDYGVADIIFGDGALDTEQIHTAISMWEERADVILTESNITVDQLVRYVSVMVNSTHA
jgi:phage baseplate assembly protein W